MNCAEKLGIFYLKAKASAKLKKRCRTSSLGTSSIHKKKRIHCQILTFTEQRNF